MPRQPDDNSNVLGDDVLQALADGLPPSELTVQRRNSMRARVMSRARDAQSPGAAPTIGAQQPPDTETIRGDDVPWHEAWPKVWIKVLKRDQAADMQVTLFRFEPGGCIPGHAHRKDEECFVLEGEVLVGTYPVRAGDFHIARAGGSHPDLVSRTGALVMLRSELY